MALRCKPGDMAVCIEGSAVGTFVTVKEAGTPHPFNGLPSWVCLVRTPCRVTLVDSRTNRTIRHGVAPAGSPVQFLDRELQPIRPTAPPETIAIPAPPQAAELETQ
jgi:hypothetical protein